jgi:GTPase SAR1 family protein
MKDAALEDARRRIADCLQLDEQDRLVQRRDYLNLAGLGLTDAELVGPFSVPERGLKDISFASLPHLRYLDLTGNQLTELPACVTGFASLVWLGLNFNRIMRLPETIGNLTKLQRLYLRENVLEALPNALDNLRALVELDAHGNRIAEPPVSLLPLLEDKREAGPLQFDVGDNASQWSLAVSAAGEPEAQRAALRNYLREIHKLDGSEILRQGKLLLVGEGGVGKTTLLDVLRGLTYNDRTDTTHGLELHTLEFAAEDGWEGTLHAWDFSGQPAMRQTHQLFFTAPALYLLVWNHREARENETSAELAEWLTLIDQRTQGQGRVLLVAKKANDRSAEPPFYDDLRRRFGRQSATDKQDPDGVLLPGCLKVDSKGPQAAEQVRELRRRIAAYAARTPSFRERCPRSWVAAQRHFRQLREGKRAADDAGGADPKWEQRPCPYLQWSEFVSQCSKLGLADAEEYAKAQHRLGTLVWVDTERLRHVEPIHVEPAQQLVVLNPDWLSKAIGFVIERDDKDRSSPGTPVPLSPAAVSSGLVSARQMDAIWTSPPQPRQGPKLEFPPGLFNFFRHLMRAFDIARPVKQEGSLHERWHLVPNRLPDAPPEAWHKAWRSDLPRVYWRVELRVTNGDPLNHWLALAIFYRLMIVLHSEAQGRQNFADAAHWWRGFMLAPAGGGLARVEFTGSDRRDAARCVGFDIQVASHQPRELWAVFAEGLIHLKHDLEDHYGFTSIVVNRLVSCPANQCDREPARRCYIDEAVVAQRAHSGARGWREEKTVCSVTGCGRDLRFGWLWDGRAANEPGPLDRIEAKLDRISECGEATRAEVRSLHTQAGQSRGELLAELADIRQRLGDSLARVLAGQEVLGESLREAMERASEQGSASLREFVLNIHDPASDLPRLYTLTVVRRWWLALLGRRTWRLWLHCEKTGYPAPLALPDKRGEFTIAESPEFLRKMEPYIKGVSHVLVALGPVAALVTGANPVVGAASGAAIFLAEWARDYQTSMRRLAAVAKDQSETGYRGMKETGTRPLVAEKESLSWLHSFLRKDPTYVSRLGLMPKVDGQGRRWWVLPQVEV